MVPILDALFEEKDVAALVDGGTASNVPIELAWKRVMAAIQVPTSRFGRWRVRHRT